MYVFGNLLFWVHFMGLGMALGCGIALSATGPRLLAGATGEREQAWQLFKAFSRTVGTGLLLLLITGPLMIWWAGEPVEVFSLMIASPLPASAGMHNLLRALHGKTATFIVLGILLHVAAVFKHVILNRDGTFDKIMIASRVRHE